MTLEEFVNLEMSPAKAFLLGMIFPLYTEKTAANGNRYVLAQVRHNAAHISEEDILEHHKRIKQFLGSYKLSEKIKITANQTEEFGNLSGALRGFTLLIEKDSSENENASFQKIYKLVSKLKFESIENKRFFIKGIFDGRCSMDTNSHLIVVDYKLSEDTFQTFSDIVESVGFELTPNKRHDGEARNAQFRIKTSSLKKFNDEIGFFSVRRQNYLNDMLKKLGVDK